MNGKRKVMAVEEAFMHVCVCECVRACMRASVCVCVRARADKDDGD